MDAEGWQRVRPLLPKDFQQRARDMRLIRPVPAQLKAKVEDIEPVLRLVLLLVVADVSLKVATAQGAASGILTLSPVALHLWLRKLGAYLDALLAEVWQKQAEYGPEAWAGYEVEAVDGTAVAGPAARGMTARVHYAVRLSDAHVSQVHVTSPKVGESFKRFAPGACKGKLYLGDRGLCHADGIWALKQKEADVLVRYGRGTLVLLHAKGRQRVDVLALARRVEGRRVTLDVDVVVPAEGERPEVKGRLLLKALPPDKAEEARKRLRKRQRKQPVTEETLYWAGFIALFTTVPKRRLSATKAFKLYRARWQVELSIKRDKSLSGLSHLPNKREDTVRSWLTAKLLAIALARRLGAEAFPPSGLLHH